LKKPRLYGLIGKPLSHSFSKKYFEEKFQREGIEDALYQNFPLDSIDMLTSLLEQHPSLAGLNVTIPYKKPVIELLDSMDEISGTIGAVNTIKIIRSGTRPFLAGYNTDVHGFRNSLVPCLRREEKKALVLGTGGASEAVVFVLYDLGIEPVLVSRNPSSEKQLSYHDLNPEIVRECRIIINATPVGMYPDINRSPDIPYDGLTGDHLLYDLVYNPEITVFLQKGRDAGATIVNGNKMLELQAERSWQVWNG
jgi:shikimate dehydrogenase